MTEFTTWRSLVDGEEISAIPDSVVSRPDDNDNFDSSSSKLGVQFETEVEWEKIGAEISSNTSGFTHAYVYRVADSELMGSVDISSLSAGSEFTVDLSKNIGSGESYNFVVDADGDSFSPGLYNNSSFPYDSDDSNLKIVQGAIGVDGDHPSNSYTLKRIGNVGFN